MTGPRFALAAGGSAAGHAGRWRPVLWRRIIRRGRSRSSFRSAPAGPADVTARQIGSILQENFGQPFVVENRTGAGGVIGTRRGREIAARRLYAADDVEHPDRE